MSWKSFACVLLASTLVFGAVGCGSQSGTAGFGSFALTSTSPNPVFGMIPTPVTITGGDFSNVIGTTCEVKWCAPAGSIPFLGGTSDETTSVGTITSATTIDTVSPRAVICGPTSLAVVIKVTLPSGVWGSSVVPIITFLAPTMTSISGGGIFPAAIPTPFTITGTGYGDIGSPVTIHWRSTDGAVPTPFEAGGSATIETSGVVASATTITGVSPLALVCGPASSSAEIYKIYFQDGSCTPNANPPLPVTFVAPTVTLATNTGGGLDNGTNGFAAAIPESFTLTGTGYGPVGGTATVNVTAAANSIFVNGTSTTTAVSGTIISSTQIDVPESAWALMCNNPPGITTENVTFDVVLPDGSCTPTGAGTAGVYNAPQITAIANNEVGGLLFGTNDFDAARPVDFTVTGTRLGSAGDLAQVVFTVLGGPTPFDGGTSATTTVNASVVNPTTVTGISPAALVCGVASNTANTDVISPGGSCTPVPTTADFLAPTVTAVTNTSAAGEPYSGTTAPAGFAAAVPEPFQVTGTGFGPIGGTAFVLFQNNAGGFPTPYENGTSETVIVPAEITSATTIDGLSPAGAFCSINGTANAGGSMTVTMPDGACTLDSGFQYVMNPPTVTAIANLDRGGATFEAAIPETFELTGTDFGPVGGTAIVRWRSFSVGTAATPFPGPSAEVTALATITSRTTMEGISPEALLCPVPPGDPATGINADIEILATLEGGACNTTNPGAADFGEDFPALILGPTLVSSDLLIATPPASGAAGGPALDVPTTLYLGEDEMPDFRITGTGFAPLGAIVLVTFDDIGNGTGAADLNGAATLTVPAIVVSETVIEGQLPIIDAPRLALSEVVRTTVTLAPNGSCAYDDALINLVAPPTPTAVTNNEVGVVGGLLESGYAAGDMHACTASSTDITGTGFHAVGVTVVVYSTNDGLDPNTDLPLRLLGTATPVAGARGDYGFDFPAAVIVTSGTSMTGGCMRFEPSASVLDTDGDGLVPYTLRMVNPDGQYGDLQAGDYRVQTATVNVGASAVTNRNNNDCALDPTSFTDDFLNPGAAADLDTSANIAVVSGDDPGGIGPTFSSVDSFAASSTDGGITWTSGAGGLAGVDGAGAAEFRNFFQVEYDSFGNLIQTYLLDDFTAGTSTIVTTSNGVLLDTVATGAGLVGLFSQPSMAVGNSSGGIFPGGQKILIGWVDSTFAGGPFDLVTARRLVQGAFGGGLINGPFNSIVSDAPPVGFNFGEVQCAIGPNGEDYVAWQDQFVGPFLGPFSHTIYIDDNPDGLAIPNFFGVDNIVATEPIPAGFGLPAAPDTGPFIPLMDMCVAQTGVHSGRVALTNENVVPIGPGLSRDHAQVNVRTSDDFGTNWSAAVVPHSVDEADRFIPAICSDPTDGRFYLTWYDTVSGLASLSFTAYERYAASSADGTTWGASLNLSAGRGTSTHIADFDTDFGVYADVDAYGGCVVATWNDLVDSALADPVVVMYQQR